MKSKFTFWCIIASIVLLILFVLFPHWGLLIPQILLSFLIVYRNTMYVKTEADIYAFGVIALLVALACVGTSIHLNGMNPIKWDTYGNYVYLGLEVGFLFCSFLMIWEKKKEEEKENAFS